jgi:hypothetical protein
MIERNAAEKNDSQTIKPNRLRGLTPIISSPHPSLLIQSMNDDSGILAQGKDKAKTDMARIFANAGKYSPD